VTRYFNSLDMGGLDGRNDHQWPAHDGVWRDVVAEVPDRGHKDRREVVVCWGVGKAECPRRGS
jgi:hypothetical protein